MRNRMVEVIYFYINVFLIWVSYRLMDTFPLFAWLFLSETLWYFKIALSAVAKQLKLLSKLCLGFFCNKILELQIVLSAVVKQLKLLSKLCLGFFATKYWDWRLTKSEDC